ncbi:MAG TPA: type II secretion system protein GspG, partial [Capsulimonadaceae bacterium]|nr:type II secretion system protein GspG [Capsulimonadaceae bacterium]
LLLLALALHAYKLDHNSYPSTLSQLAPAYLKNIPSDPFAERGPMRYRRMKETYLLYSVGPDGKDNGGTPIFQPLTIAGKPYGRARYGIINMNSKGDIVAGINAML